MSKPLIITNDEVKSRILMTLWKLTVSLRIRSLRTSRCSSKELTPQTALMILYTNNSLMIDYALSWYLCRCVLLSLLMQSTYAARASLTLWFTILRVTTQFGAALPRMSTGSSSSPLSSQDLYRYIVCLFFHKNRFKKTPFAYRRN